MTDQQSELDQRTRRPEEQQGSTPESSGGTRRPGGGPDPIAAGLDFLFSRRQEQSWGLSSLPGHESAWITAYVIARLGEIPSHRITYSLRQKIEKSLDWLLDTRTPGGGWGFSSGAPDDADSTSWVVIALRQHGRPVPEGPLDLVRNCRCKDGGFSIFPGAGQAPRAGAPDITAIAVRALASIDAASSEFLASHLRTDLPGTPCRLASTFFVSSTLLDWEPGMAPWFVVNAVHQLTCRQAGEGAWEQALQLRCMTRLGMQSAWALAASLRGLQQMDGSWPASAQPAISAVSSPGATLLADVPLTDVQGVLATVTSLSALAMGDLQPGLYFGSDLPFRRL